MLDSAEYRNNTGAFASGEPFHHPLVSVGAGMSHRPPSPHLAAVSASFSSFSSSLAPRLSFWYRTALSYLPLPTSWRQSKSSSSHHHHHSSPSALSVSDPNDDDLDQSASATELDMQALLKKV